MFSSAHPRWVRRFSVRVALSVCGMFASCSMLGPSPTERNAPWRNPLFIARYRSMGCPFFTERPARKINRRILLLHGLPSSSRMFEPLFARLADRYHLVAPDYPGFGHSDWPDPKKFAYTFDHIAEVMNHFTEAARALALHALHAGLRRPGWFSHDTGPSRAGPGADRAGRCGAQRRAGGELEDAAGVLGRPRCQRERAAYKSAIACDHAIAPRRNDPNVERYDPDLWTDEFYFLNQPGQVEIQSDLFYDYRTNVEATPNGKRGCATNSRACW